MSKKLILAAVMVALLAMPAFAAVQSVKVSGELDTTWLVRDQFDLGDSSTATDSEFYQNLLITQAIVRFDADLTDNVSVTTAFLSERPWHAEDDAGSTADHNDVDITLANVQIREFLNSNFSVIIVLW